MTSGCGTRLKGVTTSGLSVPLQARTPTMPMVGQNASRRACTTQQRRQRGLWVMVRSLRFNLQLRASADRQQKNGCCSQTRIEEDEFAFPTLVSEAHR